ncbi:MAG: SAM-dependent DNA methyltransferase, partial [Candidatus Heimdallarchaeota archaeon]
FFHSTGIEFEISMFFDLLKQAYPKLFVSSVLESIASLSTLMITPSQLEFDNSFLSQSVEIISVLYLEILDQKFRRKMGQFWTPPHIAELLVELILENEPKNILDPCTGPGTFIRVLQQINPKYGGKVSAVELHPLLFEISTVNLYNSPFNTEIIHDDFLTINSNQFNNTTNNLLALDSNRGLDLYFKHEKTPGFESILCNPPYSRHHTLSSRIKEQIGDEIEQTFANGNFSRISSLFMYFILKSLKLIIINGRMVFITPTIIFESRNSAYLKKILKERFRVPYIIIFHHSLNVFPGVDTAACIFTVEGKKPKPTDVTKLLILNKWTSKEKILNYLKIESNEVFKWKDGELYSIIQNELHPDSNWTSPGAFSTVNPNDKLIRLSEYFNVMRGIATGKNEYFTFTDDELDFFKIKKKFVVPTITKTRYVQKHVLSEEDFYKLRKEDKKIWLLNIQPETKIKNDQDLLKYLDRGLKLKVHEGSLVKTRKKWFQTEKRDIPYFIFTYLSRGNPRFILNEAQVRPLNTFLMIYPKRKNQLSKDVLSLFWVILNSSATIRSLRDVGRCYGGNTLKLEPKEMMKALIINPFNISKKSQRTLLDLVPELKKSNVGQSKEIMTRIDTILEKELK